MPPSTAPPPPPLPPPLQDPARATLSAALERFLRLRLLHAGVATGTILTVFLDLVRDCIAMDASGGVLGRCMAAVQVRPFDDEEGCW